MKRGKWIPIILVLTFFLIVFSISNVDATDYYVNATSGSDSNNGLTPGTAWKTISKVNGESFSPGDNIYFERGQTWREQLSTPSSGNSSDYITFGAYGSGDKPIISGSDLVTIWSQNDTNIWNASLTTEPDQVFFDGTRGTSVAYGDINSENEWNWTSNMLYIYYTEDPSGAVTIEATQRTRSIQLGGKNYLTFDGLHLKHGLGSGSDRGLLHDWDNSGTAREGLIVQNSIFSYGGDRGLNINLASATGTFNNLDIHDNTFEYFDFDQGWGARFNGAQATTFTNLSFYQNILTNNYQGVRVNDNYGTEIYRNNFSSGQGETDILPGDNTVSMTIYYNRHEGGTGEAIWIGTSGINGINIYGEIISGLTLNTGIVIDQGAQNINISNSVFYNLSNDAFSIGNSGQVDTGIVLKNNIVDNLAAGNVNLAWGESSSFTSNYNCWDENRLFYDTDSATTRNWAYWTDTLGHGANSLYQDCNLSDPDNNNFTLQPTSPAIDAGIDVGLTSDYLGNTIPLGLAPDIGAYEYVDNVLPTITFSCSPTSVTTGNKITCSCSATDDVDSSPTVVYTINPSTSHSGTFTTTCTATDNFANSKISYIDYTVSEGGHSSFKPIQAQQLEEGYTINLRKSGEIKFFCNDETHILNNEFHTLKVDNIVNDKVTITISSDPITFDLNVGQTKKLDLHSNGFYDFEIFLERIVGTSVWLTIKLIDEEIPVGETEKDVSEKKIEEKINWFLLVVGLIIGIIFIIILIKISKYKKKKL